VLKLQLRTLAQLPREARDTLFLLAVIAWVLLPQINHLPLWCSALATLVLLWRGRLAWLAQPLPGRLWLTGLLCLAMGATWFTHRTILGRDAGVTLIVVLLALKTLELRAKRDAFVIFFLGFFTMLTNFLFSQSLLTAAAMLIGLLGLLTALVNAHMPVGKPPLMQAARIAGGMALLGAPLMAVLFVLFPRAAPLWGIPSDGITGRSGLSATMQVGTLAQLALDDSIAMRLRFEGPVPPTPSLYFRGPVLSHFDGREWLSLPSPKPLGVPPEDRLQTLGEPVHYQVTLEANSRPWVMVLDATPQAPLVPAGLVISNNADLQWLADRSITDLVRYQATSYPDFRYGPRQYTQGLQDFIDLPPGFNPRTLQLAADMRRDPRLAEADSATLSAAVLKRLRTGGYSYTLDPGVYGVHVADEFWFDKKEGFCEHIATAYVLLMRALDVPARVVTGYQGGEANKLDGFWVVRQSDAHAWAEIWQAGQGWVRVDPTAAVSPGRIGNLTRLTAPRSAMATAFGTLLNPTLTANLRAAWEAVNNNWNQWVLNYSQSKQLNLLRNLGFIAPSWEDLGYLLSGLLVATSLCGAVWALWERRQHDPWLRLLHTVHCRLSKLGLALPTQSPPRQIAYAVQQRFGPQGQALHHWLLRFERQRYAPPQNAQASDSLRQLQRDLRTLVWPTSPRPSRPSRPSR